MKYVYKLSYVFAVLMMMSLVSCGNNSPVEVSNESTTSPRPTQTEAPSPTPEATPASLPLQTPAPSPTPTSEPKIEAEPTPEIDVVATEEVIGQQSEDGNLLLSSATADSPEPVTNGLSSDELALVYNSYYKLAQDIVDRGAALDRYNPEQINKVTYLRVIDFDNNEIPELVIGMKSEGSEGSNENYPAVSFAIYQYKDKKITKTNEWIDEELFSVEYYSNIAEKEDGTVYIRKSEADAESFDYMRESYKYFRMTGGEFQLDFYGTSEFFGSPEGDMKYQYDINGVLLEGRENGEKYDTELKKFSEGLTLDNMNMSDEEITEVLKFLNDNRTLPYSAESFQEVTLSQEDERKYMGLIDDVATQIVVATRFNDNGFQIIPRQEITSKQAEEILLRLHLGGDAEYGLTQNDYEAILFDLLGNNYDLSNPTYNNYFDTNAQTFDETGLSTYMTTVNEIKSSGDYLIFKYDLYEYYDSGYEDENPYKTSGIAVIKINNDSRFGFTILQCTPYNTVLY